MGPEASASNAGSAGAAIGLDSRLRTVSEVADDLRVSNMTVYRLIKSGQLPAVRVGKNYRIRQGDLTAYLQARSVHVEQQKG